MSKFNTAILPIAYAEIWNRIIYYGLQATLVIYVITVLGVSEARAYQFYGAYAGLTLGLSTLGGTLGDRVFGSYYSVVIGSLLVIIGNTILCWENVNSLLIAISFIAVGVGLFKPNNSILLGEIIHKEVSTKGRLFSLFYLFINVGSLVGPILYGYFTNTHHHKVLYIIASLGMLSGIIVLQVNYCSQLRFLEIRNNLKLFTVFLSLVLILSLVILSSLLLRFEKSTNVILIIFTLVNCSLILKIVFTESKKETNNLKLLIVPIVCSIVYFVFLLQIYTSLMTYINQYVDKTFFGWELPAPWFSTLEPLFLILFVPLLNSFWSELEKRYEISETNKIIAGLLLASISFSIFSLATITSYSTLNLIFIIIANIILALAELCVIPLSISLINTLAPHKYKATIMAIFYSSLAISGYLAGLIAKISIYILIPGYNPYAITFAIMSLILLFFFFLVVFINRYLNQPSFQGSHL